MIQRLSILIIGLWVGGVQAQVTFTDVTDSAGITASGYLAGTAWGDYNNDGFQDLYLGSFWGDTCVLYQNNGNGTFTDVTWGAGVPGYMSGNQKSPTWADYDNDGDLDLFIAPNGNTKILYRNNGDGTFTNVAATAGFVDSTTPQSTEGLGIADYDADGHIEMFLATGNIWDGEPNILFHNNGNGTFSDVTAPAGVPTGTELSRNVAWADYDNDGDIDVYISNYGMHLDWLLQNNGDGTFTNVASSAGFTIGDHTLGAAWGDYDNDGDLDLAYAAQHVPPRLWRNNGNGTFTECAASAGFPTGSREGLNMAWADYDNDGYLDLYFSMEQEGGIYDQLYHNNGDGTFTDVTSSVGLTGSYSWGVSWADYDNDGDLDLQRFEPGTGGNYAKLYRNDGGNANHWIEIDLVGTDCNRAAIGARARVVAGALHQIREVEGGAGLESQNSLTLEFGLGAYTSVDTLEVRWPCGRVERETNIPANQIITRIEGWTGVEEDRTVSKKTKNFTLSQAYPNPFSRLTVLGYQLPVVCDVYLKVYNVNGQLVKNLSNENKNPGVYKVIWDGKDDLGRQVSSGIYFIRLEAGDFSSTKKVLRLR